MPNEISKGLPKIYSSRTSGLTTVGQLVDTTSNDIFSFQQGTSAIIKVIGRMNLKNWIQEKIEYAPEIISKKLIEEKFEILLAAESSLKKDWLQPEEDEAWRNL